MRRLLGALVAVAAVLGGKYYGKSSTHDEVKARLVELCEGDEACRAAVAAHFEGCFDSAYTMGGRRTASRLDLDGLVACVNRESGERYFAVNKEQK